MQGLTQGRGGEGGGIPGPGPGTLREPRPKNLNSFLKIHITHPKEGGCQPQVQGLTQEGGGKIPGPGALRGTGPNILNIYIFYFKIAQGPVKAGSDPT